MTTVFHSEHAYRGNQRKDLPMAVKKARKAGPHKEPRRRRTAKASHKVPVAGKKRRNGTPQPKGAPVDRAASLELRLRKTVAELGLTEARKIFASVEAAFGEVASQDND